MGRLLSIMIALALAAPAGKDTATTAPARPADSQASTVTCTFSNPSYSGYCKQTESIPQGSSGNAVCQDILGCLNNTQCTKTYCNATEIRGGWQLVSAVENPSN